MSSIECVDFEQVDCGKKIQGSKKRFRWRFKIGGNPHTLQLANSAVSGKKRITLDSEEIYSEKNFFNIDFDFTHSIEGHAFRINRVPDKLTEFELRIDNRSFEQLKSKGEWNSYSEKTQSKFAKNYDNDAFSEFSNFVSSGKPVAEGTQKNNEFGEFDFDSFSKNTVSQPKKQLTDKEKQNKCIQPNIEMGKKPNPSAFETINFQTNNFQTNSFGNFADNFKNSQQKMPSEDNFVTGYNHNNFYSDLLNSEYDKRSEKFDNQQFNKKPQGIAGYIEEKFGDKKVSFTGKQAMNKIKQVAESIKMTVTGQNQDLI